MLVQSTNVEKCTFLTCGVFGGILVSFHFLSKMVVDGLVFFFLYKFLGLANACLQCVWGFTSLHKMKFDSRGCFTHGVAGVKAGE